VEKYVEEHQRSLVLAQGGNKIQMTDQIRKSNTINTGGGQIKSNQMEPPRKQSKSNPNQIPAQGTQMGPNGGAREPRHLAV
jgi:hypothetical protein